MKNTGVTEVTKMSLPERGETRVNLACVCNVKGTATGRVLTGTRVSPGMEVGSLSRRRIGRLEGVVSGSFLIRNSLEERVTLGVGELESVGYCENVERTGNLPLEKREAGAGTEAEGNPEGAMSHGGGGWWLSEERGGNWAGGRDCAYGGGETWGREA